MHSHNGNILLPRIIKQEIYDAFSREDLYVYWRWYGWWGRVEWQGKDNRNK